MEKIVFKYQPIKSGLPNTALEGCSTAGVFVLPGREDFVQDKVGPQVNACTWQDGNPGWAAALEDWI